MNVLQYVGFAYLQSDGHIQAHLSLMAVSTTHRRRGIGRALLDFAFPSPASASTRDGPPLPPEHTAPASGPQRAPDVD